MDNKIYSIHSPDSRLTAQFNERGETTAFFETLPDGGTIPYFHRPAGNLNPLMHPWCNRIEDGDFSFEGKSYHLRPLHHPEKNALHGNWREACTPQIRDAQTIILTSEFSAIDDASKSTPFAYTMQQIFTLDNDGLNAEMHLTNNGITLPFSVGLHPFLPRHQNTILQLGATVMENCGATMIPDKNNPVIAIPANWTLSQGLVLSNDNLSPVSRGFNKADLMDNCFTDADPLVGGRIIWPDYDREMQVTGSQNCTYAVCFVPGKANDAAPGELSFFCFELATAGINSLNRENAGATILRQGETLSASTRFAVRKMQF